MTYGCSHQTCAEPKIIVDVLHRAEDNPEDCHGSIALHGDPRIGGCSAWLKHRFPFLSLMEDFRRS